MKTKNAMTVVAVLCLFVAVGFAARGKRRFYGVNCYQGTWDKQMYYKDLYTSTYLRRFLASQYEGLDEFQQMSAADQDEYRRRTNAVVREEKFDGATECAKFAAK